MIKLTFLALVFLLLPAQLVRAQNKDSIIQSLESIATQSLRSNCCLVSKSDNQVILAGACQYKTLWARDFAVAARGALLVKETKAVKGSIESFYRFQREDGTLARVVDNLCITQRVLPGVLFKYAQAFQEPLKGWFETENQVLVVDSNLWIPWISYEYLKVTQEQKLSKRWFPLAVRALDWVDRMHVQPHLAKTGLHLIDGQAPFSDWEDSIPRMGRVAFTNALYWATLRNMAFWAESLGEEEKAKKYKNTLQKLKIDFFKTFWLEDEGYFSNFILDQSSLDKKYIKFFEQLEASGGFSLSPDRQLLTDKRMSADTHYFLVSEGLLEPALAERIMSKFRASPLWQPIPGRPTYPLYPDEIKSFIPRLVNLADYHDACYWLWITGLAAKAEAWLGHSQEVEKILLALGSLLEEYQSVFEVYESTGTAPQLKLNPVSRFFYRAEHPFSESSGQIIEAAQRLKELKKHKVDNTPKSLFNKYI